MEDRITHARKKTYVENTVLVGIINAQQDEDQSKEYLDELAFLALTAGGKDKAFHAKISIPNPKTFIGRENCRSRSCS